eukprot:TRINITY_DN7004_c0_g1_i1.p1 TRINITY_DN7004_c0_g1~~TRINITY_DN7004_c0_g1_i1.p1  ORF type:complete len:381 (+),score=55.43 TRINITY_DN7004_c0_g1_i1:95-1237(+)
MGRLTLLEWIVVGTEKFEVCEDRAFALLRHRLGIKNDFLENNFDFAGLAPGGGKGGELMARTKDKRWFIKQLSPGDLQALYSPDFLDAYVAHMTSGKDSLLSKMVLLFRRKGEEKEGNVFLVMSNCLPSPTSNWGHDSGEGKRFGWTFLFDLKGCRDDKLMERSGLPTPQVHKRCWKCNWLLGECCSCCQCCKALCCLTPERIEYQTGKELAFTHHFHLDIRDATELIECINRDASFLSKAGLMDYSAIVGAVEIRDGVVPPAPGAGDLFSPPLVAEYAGRKWAYYWGIIDYLQLWTTGKKIAHVIKCCFAPKPISTIAPPEYCDQFTCFVRERIQADGRGQDRGPVAGTPAHIDETEPLAHAAGAAPPPERLAADVETK